MPVAPLGSNSAVKKPARSKNDSQVMKDKVAARNACKKQMKEQFKSLDLFGQQVSLTWNGEDQYKTSIGASLSTIIWIIMIAYTVMRFTEMVQRDSPSIAKFSLIKTAEQDQPFNPQKSGFDFAFGLSKPLDPTIGFFTVNYINQTVVDKVRDKGKEPL